MGSIRILFRMVMLRGGVSCFSCREKQTYTITAVDDPRRPTKIKLTQDDRPTNTIILSKEPIQYPFIN